MSSRRRLRSQAGVVRVDLAHQKYLITQTGNGFADHAFGAALGVHFRRVDQSHAEFDALAQRRHFTLVRRAILAHAPGALADHWNLHACQFKGTHSNLLC